jgi:predicted nucleic acid-binding protein
MSALVHLDTNILICGIDPQHSAHKRLRTWQTQGKAFAVSAIAWAEFRCGPISPAVLAAWERLLDGNIVPVDRIIAERAADLFNLTGRRSRSLPDCIIAGTAMRAGATLATLNRADFTPMIQYGLALAR